MPKLTPQEFIDRWQQPGLLEMNESQLAQTHFNDICALVDHPDPIGFGNKEIFSFEFANLKPDGRKGRADVFYQGRFIWEYKGFHANMDKAYEQLLLYKDALGNPPLLITCDIYTIIVHTNYTNTVKKRHIITFEELNGDGLDKLNIIFNGSLSEIEAMFKPEETREYITKTTANQFMHLVDGVRNHLKGEHLTFDNEEQAHFFIRLLFCLFAESIGLLPDKLFTKIVEHSMDEVTDVQFFVKVLTNLFNAMHDGEPFGYYRIPHFNGGLFDNDFVPPSLPTSLIKELLTACRYDWSQLEPSVLGTLFERILDTTKRHQIGAHYTSKADIELIIKPVLMQPLLDEWQKLKGEVMLLLHRGEQARASAILQTFAAKIAAMQVLDPACGSGNFLYIALQHLLDLQKEVIVLAERYGLPAIPLTVSPQQLHGMELNIYAHELAQITVWIGYIQWRYENGLEKLPTPILRPLDTIKRMDAILGYDEQGNPYEPEWVAADVIIGNPPFLGDKKMRLELGDEYVEKLRNFYSERIPGQSDLVCYWFELSRAMIERKKAKRVGLLATQGIRGGANRVVLERIKATGDIFMAWSDRKWVLAGATVHISIIGFDDGHERKKFLDGRSVKQIHANLANQLNLTLSQPLAENLNLTFIGVQKNGPFDLTETQAQAMLSNPVNNDVIKPWINALDVVQRPRHKWIIDFGVSRSLEEAAQYEQPFRYVEANVKPNRLQNRDKHAQLYWWRLQRPRPEMRHAIASLSRCMVTPMVSKHRIFVWIETHVVAENLLVVIARDDDYFLGILHSTTHELWARRMGTQLREASSGSRYTPTTTFETIPFPWPPGHEPRENENETVQQIAYYARELVKFRDNWLNPPADSIEIGAVVVQKRTLTNLYNALEHYRKVKPAHETAWGAALSQIIALGNITPKKYLNLTEIETLDLLHTQLDHAVLAAYGWEADLEEEEILANLLALNLERTAQQRSSVS